MGSIIAMSNADNSGCDRLLTTREAALIGNAQAKMVAKSTLRRG